MTFTLILLLECYCMTRGRQKKTRIHTHAVIATTCVGVYWSAALHTQTCIHTLRTVRPTRRQIHTSQQTKQMYMYKSQQIYTPRQTNTQADKHQPFLTFKQDSKHGESDHKQFPYCLANYINVCMHAHTLVDERRVCGLSKNDGIHKVDGGVASDGRIGNGTVVSKDSAHLSVSAGSRCIWCN